MGLREAFQKAAVAAMKAAGNIKIDVTYISITNDAGYNTSTGAVTAYKTGYNVEMFFDKNSNEDIKNMAVDSNQQLGYIAVNDLKPTPKIKDRILIDNVEWTVVEFQTDPAKALWIIKIQEQ
jgi:hypothetical protein